VDSDRIEQALAALPALTFQQDTLGLRSLLEDLYDGAQDDLLAELCGVEYAAARWEVTDRRARAHIARLHAKYGIGQQIGGAWLLRRSDVDAHRPDRKYRVK
jgi:hypothetical protein